MKNLFAPPTDEEIKQREEKRYAHFVATFDNLDDNRLILDWAPMLIETQKHIERRNLLRLEGTHPLLNAKEQLLLVRAWEDEIIDAIMDEQKKAFLTTLPKEVFDRLGERLPAIAREHVSLEFRVQHNAELIRTANRQGN